MNNRDPSSVVDVVCAGEMLFESIVVLQAQPPVNSTVIFQDDAPAIGGAVVNVAWYLSQLGKSVRILAPIAQQDVSLLHQELQTRNIDLNHLIVTSGSTDHLYTVLTAEDHRSIYAVGPTPSNLEIEITSRAHTCKSLALNGGRRPAIRSAYMNVVRDFENRLIAFNPSYSIYEYSLQELQKIIQGVDIFIANQEEYAFLEDIFHEPMYIENMPRLAFIHTKGREGAELFSRGKHWTINSLASRDGTFLGAGDAFLAGFISRILDGDPPEQAMEHSSRLAAAVVISGKIRTKISRNTLSNHSGDALKSRRVR